MHGKTEISRLIRQQRLSEAKRLCDELCQQYPDDADAWRMMARIATSTGDEDAEIHSLEKIVSISPTQGLAHFNLASCLDKADRHQQAEPHYRKAIELKYQPARLLSSLGMLLHKLGRSEEGIDCCKEALATNKYLVDACTNLGRIYADTALPELALEQMLRAKKLAPKSCQSYYNLGLVYDALVQSKDAIDSYRTAIKLNPDFVDAHWNLSLALLRSGQFLEGWKLYESRWKRGAKNLRPREYLQPVWNGSDLKGKRIYLYAEQGYGDTIQFIRYARLLKSLGAWVIFECQPQLESLLNSTPGIDILISLGSPPPDFDTHAPLISLPNIIGTTLETIPQDIPYVHAAPERTAYWGARFQQDDIRDHLLRVGVVWAGNLQNISLRHRSLELHQLATHLKLTDIQLIGLQKGPESAPQVNRLPEEFIFPNYGEDFKSFADTAAAIENLDLVVTIDTAVAHLAGAMGKPVWIMLSYPPDWRWLLDREDSPWYPSMRLFRQTRPGDWQSVFRRIYEELQKLYRK